MYIRLWSGAANILVTDGDHRILDAFFRRPKRGETTGELWTPPEARDTDGEWTVRELPGDGTFNEKIDRWYGEHAETLSREALLEEARRRHESRRSRLAAALVKLEKKREQFLHADRYRHQGDLLMAYLHEIPPRAEFAELADYENDNTPIRIPLDPALSARENAEACYIRYRKAVSGLANLEDDIASTKSVIEQLDADYEQVLPSRIRMSYATAPQAEYAPAAAEKRTPGLVYRKDDWLILVGRTAAENDELSPSSCEGI